MSKIKIDNYSFDASEKKITFSDYVEIRLDAILLITNVTANVIVYNFADSLKGGTVATNVLTLTYDTALMSDTDKLLIYYDDNSAVTSLPSGAATSAKQLADGHNVNVTNMIPAVETGLATSAKQLPDNHNVTVSTTDGTVLYSGNVNVTGAGSSINSTGYASIVAQFTGIWTGLIHCEVSNDGTNWERMTFYASEELSMQDAVDQNGIYIIKVSAKYVRPFVSQLTGTVSINIIGRTVSSVNPVDMLSLALDKNNNVPLQVQLPINLKQEADGGLVLGDMKGPVVWKTGSTAENITLDCTGYQSLLVHKITSGVVTPTVSNDNLTFSATLATAMSTTTPAATILTAAGMYIVPVTGKFIRLTSPASTVTCYIYLSIQPHFPNSSAVTIPQNMANIAGNAAVTAGVNGLLAVGGNIANGVAPTANPIPLAVDDNRIPLTRRLLTDVTGRQIISTESQSGIKQFGYDNSFQNILAVKDVSRTDAGFSSVELLQEILMELKTLNLQIHELPRLIDEGRYSVDEPENIKQSIN